MGILKDDDGKTGIRLGKIVTSLWLLWVMILVIIVLRSAHANTPQMNMVLPAVGVTPGPTWATQLNTAMNVVDDHDHTTGKGKKVPTAGLNINADLTFLGNNATALKSCRMQDNGSPLAGPSDLRAVYSSGGDLYWNNASGTPVKITSGGSLNIASLGTIGGDYGGTNPASVTFTETTSTYSFLESAGKVAKMAAGPYTMFEEVIGANGITFQNPSSLASAYTLTWPTGQAAANNVMKANGSGQLSFGQVLNAEITDNTIGAAKIATSAFDGSTIENTGSIIRVKSLGIDTNQLANGAVTNVKRGTLNISSLSQSSISPSTNGGDSCGSTVSLTTVGRPVSVTLQGCTINVDTASLPNTSFFDARITANIDGSASVPYFVLYSITNSTGAAIHEVKKYPANFSFIVTGLSSGSHTFGTCASGSGFGSAAMSLSCDASAVLRAYEL